MEIMVDGPGLRQMLMDLGVRYAQGQPTTLKFVGVDYRGKERNPVFTVQLAHDQVFALKKVISDEQLRGRYGQA